MEVFVTQTGKRYHSRNDLSCLENAKGVASVNFDVAVAGGLMPCTQCDPPGVPGVSEGDARWLRAIDDWSKAEVFESFWEQAFARRVLARIPELSSDSVQPQANVRVGQETFKVDFLIPASKIVLEIDGYAKSDALPSPSDLERRNRRDASFQAAGYKILHFSNAQVQQEPMACGRQVTAALEMKLAAAGNQSSSESAAAHEDAPRAIAPSAENEASAAKIKPVLLLVAVGAGVLAVGAVAFGLAETSSDSPPMTAVVSQESMVDVAFVGPDTKGDCPPSHPFKGNENSDSGELIVHAPGQFFYERTNAEKCFASLADAKLFNFRESER
jgi:very-short-patch-repair endonuclease